MIRTSPTEPCRISAKAASIAVTAEFDFGDKHKSMTTLARGILASETLAFRRLEQR